MEKKFIEWFKGLGIQHMDKIRSELNMIRRDKFDAEYRVVEIITYMQGGNVSERIEVEFGFMTFHRSGSVVGSIGSNNVCVPVGIYTEELEAILKKEYEALNK
jgi:hypothetical protein